MERGFLHNILRSNKTVFSFKDLVLLWGKINKFTAAARVNYYVKKGELYHIRRGLYSKDKNYDRFELAVKIFTPSYISFETVLGKAGITFQYYNRIFVATYQSREIMCDGQIYSFKTIKNSILASGAGIENKENYSIASFERAFLDVVYLCKDYHFDNLSPLNWEKVREILPIYGGNKRMERKIKEYREAAKNKIN